MVISQRLYRADYDNTLHYLNSTFLVFFRTNVFVLLLPKEGKEDGNTLFD